jgi:hypothetical protein
MTIMCIRKSSALQVPIAIAGIEFNLNPKTATINPARSRSGEIAEVKPFIAHANNVVG